MKIEFFHDVICSFCFPMSYRMRQMQKLLPNLEIMHRSFALVKSEEDFVSMFGSRTAAKSEILKHWVQANQNDDMHRFNIEGMKNKNFPFPTSIKALCAAKAAYYIGGNSAYWDVFDALQNALFVKNLNIEDDSVIFDTVKAALENIELWQEHYADAKTKQDVYRDIDIAKNYGIRGVPALVVEGKYHINGALPTEQLLQTLKNLAIEFGENMDHDVSEHDLEKGASCRFDGGKFSCK